MKHRAASMTNQQVILLIVLQAALASPGLWQFFRSFLKRRQVMAAAENLDAQSTRAAAESVRLLLEPLNTRIASLEEQLKGFTNREAQLKEEREKRETAHAAEVTSLKTVQSVMQSEIDELRGGVAVLVAQLEGAGIIPRWRPKPKTGPLGSK